MPCSQSQMRLINALLFESPEAKESVLKKVNFILHDQLNLVESSLDLLDECGHITRIICGSSGRMFWRVPSSQQRFRGGKDYLCLEGHCPCRSFGEQARVLPATTTVICKHLLAIRIATACSMVKTEIVTESVFVEQLSNE
jgi:predicted nucleic acid-binding Zn finger protein